MIKQFKKKTGSDATKDKRALQKLRREVNIIVWPPPKTCQMSNESQRLSTSRIPFDMTATRRAANLQWKTN